jgi:hypothetical protein
MDGPITSWYAPRLSIRICNVLATQKYSSASARSANDTDPVSSLVLVGLVRVEVIPAPSERAHLAAADLRICFRISLRVVRRRLAIVRPSSSPRRSTLASVPTVPQPLANLPIGRLRPRASSANSVIFIGNA